MLDVGHREPLCGLLAFFIIAASVLVTPGRLFFAAIHSLTLTFTNIFPARGKVRKSCHFPGKLKAADALPGTTPAVKAAVRPCDALLASCDIFPALSRKAAVRGAGGLLPAAFPCLHAEQIGVCACAGKPQLVPLHPVDQQPVRGDMAFLIPRPIPGKAMHAVLRRQSGGNAQGIHRGG